MCNLGLASYNNRKIAVADLSRRYYIIYLIAKTLYTISGALLSYKHFYTYTGFIRDDLYKDNYCGGKGRRKERLRSRRPVGSSFTRKVAKKNISENPVRCKSSPIIVLSK